MRYTCNECGIESEERMNQIFTTHSGPIVELKRNNFTGRMEFPREWNCKICCAKKMEKKDNK